MKWRGLAWCWTVLILGVVSACTSFDYPSPKTPLVPSSNPITVDSLNDSNRLVRLGAAQHPKILNLYGGEYHNAKLERMVAKIVGRLMEVSGDPDQPYRITILDSPNINAFALPGGYVYVTRGLLALANDAAEVAAVIAHEMAHITANHGILRQKKEAEMEVTKKVVTQVLKDRLIENETLARNQLSLARFSRNQELQADEIGINSIAKAGYDPFAAPRFLQAMEAYSQFRNISGATNARLDFLASHPATPQRVQLAISQARRVSAPGIGVTERASFLDGLDGMIYGDTESDGYVRATSFIHPKLGISFSVPKGFLIDNSKTAVLASGPHNFAIRFDRVVAPKIEEGETDTPPQSAVDYIKSGWVSGIDASSIRPLTINGQEAATARAHSQVWDFDIVVIMAGSHIYRFLTAAPKGATSLREISQNTAGSFKILSAAEIAALKPLRIRIVTVKSGESVAALAARMKGVDHHEEFFRLINALPPNAIVRAGTRVKIITE